MSLSWVWWISMLRGWVRWRQGGGQEESEPCPQVTHVDRTQEPRAHLLQQYFLQKAGLGEALSTVPVGTLWRAWVWGTQ